MFNSSSIQDTNLLTPMSAGLKVMAKLTGVEMSQKGELVFNFANSSGVLKHTEFNNCDGKPNSTEEDKKKIHNAFAKTLHLVCAFVPKEEVDKINAATYAEWCKGALALLKRHNAVGTDCVIHVIINDKGYVSLAPFPNFISTALRSCSWNADPSRYKYERTAISEADKEVVGINPFEENKSKPDILF